MNTSLLFLIHMNSTQCPTKCTTSPTSLHHDSSENPIHTLPDTINFHITEQCNYHCHFCYAKYANRSCCVSRTDGYAIIRQIADHGVRRINFAGGEPTLHPLLGDYIQYAKQVGLIVSIISNGTRITPKFLQTGGKGLDLIGISIDSARDEVERRLGRTLKSTNPNGEVKWSHVTQVKNCIKLIHNESIPVKINTVITPLNCTEDMHALIAELDPSRWKVLEVHHLQGINDGFFNTIGAITPDQFNTFLHQHQDLHPIGESSEAIKESYCMITPDGRFYQDTENYHHYSEPVLKIGIEAAFQQVNFDPKKFNDRYENPNTISENILGDSRTNHNFLNHFKKI